MRMIVEQLVEWRLAGETEVLGEILPQRHFVHHKSHMTRPGLEPRAAVVGSQRLTAWAMTRPYTPRIESADLYQKEAKFFNHSKMDSGYKFLKQMLILWHDSWEPEQWNTKGPSLLGNGAVNTFLQQQINTQRERNCYWKRCFLCSRCQVYIALHDFQSRLWLES
jgi:hypothetical protein